MTVVNLVNQESEGDCLTRRLVYALNNAIQKDLFSPEKAVLQLTDTTDATAFASWINRRKKSTGVSLSAKGLLTDDVILLVTKSQRTFSKIREHWLPKEPTEAELGAARWVLTVTDANIRCPSDPAVVCQEVWDHLWNHVADHTRSLYKDNYQLVMETTLIDPAEATRIYDHLRDLRSWQPSLVDGLDGKLIADPGRTSRTMPFPRRPVPAYLQKVYGGFRNLFGDLLSGGKIDVELQAAYYRPKEKFEVHHDAATLFDDGSLWAQNSYRYVTGILYLNETSPGSGLTSFPKLGITIKPEPGKLLLFNNFSPTGEPLRSALHAGELLQNQDEKVIVNFWLTRI
jgi:hypothetical protein